MIRFKFWEPVYYRNWNETAGKVLMHPGRFVGFAWATGDPMTFKVLQCNTDPKFSIRVLHRGTVVPRAEESAGYNSALQPKSDAYFPVERPNGGTPGTEIGLKRLARCLCTPEGSWVSPGQPVIP